MPSNNQVSWELAQNWRDQYGAAAVQRATDMFLHWNLREDRNNHVHVFFEDGVWYYNICCNANRGRDRIQHAVRVRQTMEDLIYEIETNWRAECPEYTQQHGGNFSLTKRKSRKSKKHRKTRRK